ncbi:hypothetical protein [uncultured Rhodoferax sp.]|uniref:DUF4870 family protein n=1 Tax=uncultured Rhodoferax sp. TaxID=223188 RepID=UPI0025D6B7D2|nr:hypothetical protein [uncultured Rhodoferax sp.]
MEQLQSLNTVGTISYVLHLIVAVSAFIPGGQFGVALLLAALILDMVKREDATGTWHASHFRWRIHSVLIAGVLYIVTAPLWLLLIIPGFVAWGLVSLWFLYRIISGFIAMNKGQEIGA